MKIFLDGADTGELREALTWGLIDGVTTNPSLLAKTGRPYAEVLRELCSKKARSWPGCIRISSSNAR
jgi:transaldolase